MSYPIACHNVEKMHSRCVLSLQQVYVDQNFTVYMYCYTYLTAKAMWKQKFQTLCIWLILVCYRIYYGLSKFQINRLHHIQNALAQTIVHAPKFKHITPILKSLQWLKVSERIKYKIISLTKFSIPLSLRIYMTLYLFSLLTVTTHALHLMSLSSNFIITQSHSSILPTCFTSSLELAPYITQNSSSESFIPLSDLHLNMPV